MRRVLSLGVAGIAALAMAAPGSATPLGPAGIAQWQPAPAWRSGPVLPGWATPYLRGMFPVLPRAHAHTGALPPPVAPSLHGFSCLILVSPAPGRGCDAPARPLPISLP